MSRGALWITATLSTSTLLLATHLLLPLNIDNDLYQAMGWNIAHRGLVPYVGSWAHTLPGMPYMHALAILLFGNSALGFRALDVIVHFGSALILFSIARRFMGEIGGFFAATSLTLYYVSEGFWLAGQPDGFCVFFLLLATWLYYRSTDRSSDAGRFLFFSGVAVGMAAMIRPTYGLFAVALLVVLLLRHRSIWLYLLGAFCCFAALMLPYCFTNGGFTQAYEAAIGFNLSVYGEVRTGYDLLNLMRHPLVIAALLGLALYAWERIGRPSGRPSANEWLLLLYAIAGFTSLYAMGKFLVYHFDPIFAVAAYGTGYMFARLRRLVPNHILSASVIVVLAIVGVRRLYPFNLLHVAREAIRDDQPLLQSCYTAIKDGKDFGYARETELLRYVESRHPPMIELASITPALLWRSEIPQASRFTMIHAIGMREPGRGYTPVQIEWQKEYLRDLQTKRPSLFILSAEPHNLSMFSYHDPATIVRQIPGIDRLLDSNYVFDTAIGPFQCYRLR